VLNPISAGQGLMRPHNL